MENLSPHRKFKGPATIKPTFRPFYRFKWPKDLPDQCPICGTGFHTGVNLRIGTNGYGRFMRKAWVYAIIPCGFLIFMGQDLFPETTRKLNQLAEGLPDLMCLILFFVPAVICFLSLFCPIIRHVTCIKCDWKQEFPSLRDSRKNREQESIP
jgi:hypothetical protein